MKLGRPEVRNFLLSSALYWLQEFHIDGLKVEEIRSTLSFDDNIGPGEPPQNKAGRREGPLAVEFFRQLNQWVSLNSPGAFTIAGDSTAGTKASHSVETGGLGFGLALNSAWTRETIDYFANDAIYRKYHHDVHTFAILRAYSELSVLALPHDDVANDRRSLLEELSGDEAQKFANLRLLLAYQHGMPGKKLAFMGTEFAARAGRNPEETLDWSLLESASHEGVRELAKDLNTLHASEPALYQLDDQPHGFSWLTVDDSANSVIAFARHGTHAADDIVCIYNFIAVARYRYRVPMPLSGRWREVLNSDAGKYGGGGIENRGVEAHPEPAGQEAYSALVTLPPLAAIWLKRVQRAGPASGD